MGSDDRAREHLRAHPLWRLREHPRALPPNSLPSRREGRAPPGHGGGHGRRPSAPHAATPEQRRARVDPPRAAPRGLPGFQVSSSPDRRPHRVAVPRDRPDFR